MYRDPTPLPPGYADVPMTRASPWLETIVRVLFGGLGLLGLAILLVGVAGALFLRHQTHHEWPLPLLLALVGLPLMTAPLIGRGLSRAATRPIQLQRLETLAQRLGGEWFHVGNGALAGTQPELRVEVDGTPARFVPFYLPRQDLVGSMIVGAVSEPWAKISPGHYQDAVRLHMLTNQRVPYFVSFVSRTRLSSFRAQLPEVRLPEPLGTRLACFAAEPERLRAALEPDVLEAIRGLLESNYPYLTRVRFDQGGGHWESLWTEHVHADAMVWRLRTMGWLAWRLSADSR